MFRSENYYAAIIYLGVFCLKTFMLVSKRSFQRFPFQWWVGEKVLKSVWFKWSWLQLVVECQFRCFIYRIPAWCEFLTLAVVKRQTNPAKTKWCLQSVNISANAQCPSLGCKHQCNPSLEGGICICPSGQKVGNDTRSCVGNYSSLQHNDDWLTPLS